MEPAEEECGGSGSPRQGPVPQAPTLTAPGLAPVQAAWPAGAEGGGAGGGGGGKLRSPPTSSPASAGSPRHGASADKQQLLQQLLAVAAEEERQSGSPTGAPLSAGAGLTTAQQFGTLFPAAAAAPMPHLLAQQGLPFAAQPFSGQVSPTTAPGLTLAQLLQAQLAAEHAQREATPEQLEAAAGEEMVEAGQRSQQWQPEGEEEEEEEGMEGGERKAARRESNRQAAARYRQRQKEQRDQVAAQLEAARAQRAQLLAEREQLTTEHLALARMEAVQRELHQSIVELCRPDVGVMAAALQAAAHGTSPSEATPPAFPTGQPAQLIEQAEQRFAEELRQVVEAGDHEAQAAAALRLLPASHHAALGASPSAFAQLCNELQHEIHQLMVQQAQQQQAAQQQPGVAGDVNFPVRLDAMHKCAVLRKLLVAMALAAPSPDQLLRVVAASSTAPPDTWRHAADALLPTLCAEQLEQLHRARQQWVGDMGRVLAARGYQLSRPQLQSWRAAATAMQPGGAGGGSAPQAAAPAGPGPAAPVVASGAVAAGMPHTGTAAAPPTSAAAAAAAQPAAAQPAAGGQEASAAAPSPAEAEYSSMAAAAVQRGQLLRGLRGVDDTSQRGFGCLVALIVSTLQIMTLWQCTLLLAACYPHFPDPAAILAQLLDCDDDPPQQAQPMQIVELPPGGGDVAG